MVNDCSRAASCLALFVFAAAFLGWACGDPATESSRQPPTVQEQINLPPGFDIGIYADNLVRPRSLSVGNRGTVFVGTYFFTKGVTSPVYALRDTNADHTIDDVIEIRNSFNTPNGVAFHGGDLYIVDEDRVFRIDDIESNLLNPSYRLINDALPSRAATDSATPLGHWWRYLAVGPDGRVYVAVGTRWSISTADHVNEIADDPIYSTIVRMNSDGSDLTIVADGVRNSMGMDFHPVTGELWFTDNGTSWPFQHARFYDIPPDELNRLSSVGQHFGFPFKHGSLVDPVVGDDTLTASTLPVYEFLAHTAPLGMRFYTGDMFPPRFRNAIFVAEHGTEATTPAPLDKLHGDRISVIFLDDQGKAVDYQVFADGFRQGSNADYTRRPVDLLVMPDGALLVSDDQAGVIYRISYTG